jgi:hypothetical protein
VSVADLAAVVVFDAAANPTVPPPVPVPAPEIVSHDAPLVAVQLHPAAVVTTTRPLPPLADSDWLIGEIVNEHGAAAWVTVNVLPATVSVPVRGVAAVFAVTL